VSGGGEPVDSRQLGEDRQGAAEALTAALDLRRGDQRRMQTE
jgi:hypothetical protein